MEMGAGEFKAKCLELMDWVAAENGEVIITKRGKAVAKLVSYIPPAKPDWFGCMKGSFEIIGDIVGPLGEKWEADE